MNSVVVLFSLLVACVSAGHHHFARPEQRFGAIGGRHGHGSSHSSHAFQVTDQFVQDTVKAVSDPNSNKALIQFLTCLDSPDGQAALKVLGLGPNVVPQLLKLLQGSPSDVAQAKSQIQSIVQSFSGSNYKGRNFSKIRRVFEVYQLCMGRITAKQQIKQATAEQLKLMLTALAAAEQQLGFRRINFADLLQILNDKGEQGKQEVIQKLSTWIDVATVDDLTRTAFIAYKLFVKQFNPNLPSNTTTTASPPNQFTSTTPPQNQTLTQSPAANVTSVPARPEPLRGPVKPTKTGKPHAG